MNEAAGVATRRLKPEQDLASRLRGNGAVGIAAILVIFSGALLSPVVSAVLIALWVALSRTEWAELGFSKPQNRARTLPLAVLGGAALKLMLKALVMPLLKGAPVNAAYHYLAHNPPAAAAMLLYVVVGAGFAEELFFRAYLFERLGKLFGRSTVAKVVIVIVSATLFGWAHYAGQGMDGFKQATIVGAVFGSIYARTRMIVPLMAAHATFDITAIALIYFDVEAEVAHWLW